MSTAGLPQKEIHGDKKNDITLLSTHPQVTVITVSFNAEEYLEQTIQSVIGQTYKNIEFIIIDGASSDSTLDIIKRYEEHIDLWISEPDKGIYDAMNKGIALARGQYLNFLNGGDSYIDNNVLQNIFGHNHINNFDLIYGDFYIASEDGKLLRKIRAEALNKTSIRKGMVVNHQSIFIKKSKTPFYDLNYRYKAEWNWLIDLFYVVNVTKTYYTKTPIVCYTLGGFSQKGFFQNFKERLEIIKKRFGFLYIIINIPFMCRVFIGYYLRRLLKVDTLRFWKKEDI